MRRDLGDFQTPPELVAEVLAALGPIGRRWPRVLEPSCGRGHFLTGLLASAVPPREIEAIEIQQAHTRAAAIALASVDHGHTRVRITTADVFDFDLNRDLAWQEHGPLLVIGNPPWITNSELGGLSSANRPRRRNFQKLRGFEALTGSSNFDITEAIWLKIALELIDQRPTIAFLCKTSVARRILHFASGAGLPIAAASLHRIDAARWFGAAVGAAPFCVTLGAPSTPQAPLEKNSLDQDQTGPNLEIPCYASLSHDRPDQVLSFACGFLVADRDAYGQVAFADGSCQLDWRQGLKHDAAGVMELTYDRARHVWHNGAGDVVDVEPDYIYPLIKGRDLTTRPLDRITRGVVVPQQRLGDDTRRLANEAPRLWVYLQKNRQAFTKRKSSIYVDQSPFAIFGIGPYSFAPYKIAIGGMQRQVEFRALAPVDGRPAMLDDTCYFLPSATAVEAAILKALCNHPTTIRLIGSLSFRDAKRPVTKKLLQRIDLAAILERIDPGALEESVRRVLDDELKVRSTEPVEGVIEKMRKDFAARPIVPGRGSSNRQEPRVNGL